MQVLKKLIFAIPFLVFFYLFNFYFKNFTSQGYTFLFSLDFSLLYDLLIFASFLVLSVSFFVIMSTLAQDYRLVLPITIIASIAPLIFIPAPLNIIAAGALLFIFGALFYFFDQSLKGYLTFQANHLLLPPIRNLVFLILIVYSLIFYQAVKVDISKKGFQIPDSIIDAALKFAPTSGAGTDVKGVSIAQVPGISEEQLKYLEQNPALLKQYGVDPSILKSIQSSPSTSAPANSSTTKAIKELAKSQIDNFIKPYLGFIAPALGLLFFVTIQSFTGIVSIPLPLLISGLFYIMEKTKFIHFEKEMREVRKLTI